jgi:OPT family oligopeptide transporter
MAIQHLSDEQVRTWTLEQKDRWWLANVFRGNMPQLTLRSGLTGFLLGGLLSATNLYIGAKTGWSLGVGVTSVILAFALFKVMQQIGAAREFTILENNAMQSIATAAGYMTAPLISSLTAYMIIKNELLPWWQMVTWMIMISLLGVLFAFPMKRKFINDEQHPFPEGKAAGVVMDTLHSSDASVGMQKARALLAAGGLAAFFKFLQSEGILEWIQFRLLRLHSALVDQVDTLTRQATALKQQVKAAGASAAELKSQLAAVQEKLEPAAEALGKKLLYLPEQLDVLAVKLGMKMPRIANIDVRQLTITPAMDISLMGAGGLMGIRGGLSLLVGAVLNYFILCPWMASIGEIQAVGYDKVAETATYGLRRLTLWSLWPGVACMVVASFVAFFAKPQVFVSAFRTLTGRKAGGSDVLKDIELPLWISVVGIPICSVIIAVLGHLYFGVEIWVSLVGLPLTFILAVVAANSTALTSTTPVGATSKITQLFYGVVKKGDITANVATASITAEVVSNASNLLMDIKPGYMLGAKPRQQALGHVIGIIAGSLAAVPLFFILFTHTPEFAEKGIAGLQSDKFPMPAVTVWKAVAEVLTKGIDSLSSPHNSIIYAVIIAGLVGLALEASRIATRGRFILSPIGLGLAFVMNFQSAFAMFLGAGFFWLMGVGRKREHEHTGNVFVENHEPICAGIIAGAALVGIADAIITAFVLPAYQ